MKTARTRLRIVALCVASLVIACGIWLYALSKRTVMERSERVYGVRHWDLDHHRFYWLADLKVVYTEENADVRILDVASGTSTPAPALDQIMEGMLIWHGDVRLSPNRRLFLYINDSNKEAVVCTTAGAIVARWPLVYSYPKKMFYYAQWSADSIHWMCAYYKEGSGLSGAQMYDIRKPGSATQDNIKVAASFVNRCNINLNGVVAVDIPPSPHAYSIISISCGKSISDEQPAISRIPVTQFGPTPDWIECSISPGGKYILWRSMSSTPVYGLRLHTSWPFVRRAKLAPQDTIWLSDQTGKNLKFIGRLPAELDNPVIQSEIEWLPDDKGFSLVYNSKLFVYRF